MKINNNSRRKY